MNCWWLLLLCCFSQETPLEERRPELKLVPAAQNPVDAEASAEPLSVFSIPDSPEPAAEVYVNFDAAGAAEGNEFHSDDYGLDDLLDDEYDLSGISCALISGECSACAKTQGCGYCASAGVCMDSRGPCASARPITWHWQCTDHAKWWVIVVIAICMLASCAIVTGCCLKLICCCCKF